MPDGPVYVFWKGMVKMFVCVCVPAARLRMLQMLSAAKSMNNGNARGYIYATTASALEGTHVRVGYAIILC